MLRRSMAAGVRARAACGVRCSALPGGGVARVQLRARAPALPAPYLGRPLGGGPPRPRLGEDPRPPAPDAPLRARIGENARRHALAAHSVERSAADYLAFINEVAARRPRRRLVSSVSNELALLGVSDADESVLRGVAADIAALAPAHVFEGDAVTSDNGNVAPS